jgi:hypothetical protein
VQKKIGPRSKKTQAALRRGTRAARAAIQKLTTPLPIARDSEVEAYTFIRDQLREATWIVKNPQRDGAGQVWLQNQCLGHPEITKALGSKHPEAVVKLSETQLWVIEAKRDRSGLKDALIEAEDDYAWPIQNRGVLRVPLISGVAGNDTTGYEVRTRLLVSGKYVPVTINGREATGFLDPDTIDKLLTSGNPNIADLTVNDKTFIKAAERINKILHLGGINKNDRARVMAALLLSIIEDPGPNVDADLPVLIDDINARTKNILRKNGKEEFHRFVRIEPPTSDDNHVKFRRAVIHTLQELYLLNIKSAMNSGTDVLGRFYEVFLKYGNGAKEIGIVLTPRHIARFAVESLGVRPDDIVLDPACGTGGFLVAAFDYVRKNASAAQVDRFKQFNLFGIEQESYVAALAIVNMIFRGDGKNNIIEGNCFSKFVRRATVKGHSSGEFVKTPPAPGDEPVTRVLMNPPFALKESDDKESRFIDTALKSMADGGLLFAIVPMSVMAEGGKDGRWRQDTLLAHHTLLSVVSLPEELFNPVSNQTVAVIVKKGVPHPADQPVLWARVERDGFKTVKSKRLPLPASTPNDLNVVTPTLRGFLQDPRQPVPSDPERIRSAPIDPADPIAELLPEAYVDSRVPDHDALMRRLDQQVRENVAALVEVDLRLGTSPTVSIVDRGAAAARVAPTPVAPHPKFGLFTLDQLFKLNAGDYHELGALADGTTPVATCGDMKNGVVGTYNVPVDAIYEDAMTIAFNGSPLTTKMHPYEFAAKDDVAVAIPREPMPPEAMVFIQAALNSERWRFSYYRKCFMDKLKRFKLTLPVRGDGTLDLDFMVAAVRAQPYWWFLSPRLAAWSPRASTRAASGSTHAPEADEIDETASPETVAVP